MGYLLGSIREARTPIRGAYCRTIGDLKLLSEWGKDMEARRSGAKVKGQCPKCKKYYYSDKVLYCAVGHATEAIVR